MVRNWLTITLLLLLPVVAASQVRENKMLSIRVTKFRCVGEGCAVEAESATVRFEISSDLSAACGMLRAGETYKAFRGTMVGGPKGRDQGQNNSGCLQQCEKCTA